MANLKQSKKRAKQAVNRRRHNTSLRSLMRTHLKRTVSAIEAKNKKEAEEHFKEAAKVVDKMAGKGLIHKNKAARHKQRLASRIKALA